MSEAKIPTEGWKSDSGYLNQVIVRLDLEDLRQAIKGEMAVSPTTPGTRYLIDLLTVATATSFRSVCRCSDQHERFLDVVDQLWEATTTLTGNNQIHSPAEVRAALGRAQCAEASFWALVGFEPAFQAAARVFFGMPASRHHVLATALLMPPPLGTKWQIAKSPVGMVVDEVKRNYQSQVMDGGKIKRTDAMFHGVDHCGNERLGTVVLEEVTDIPSDAVLVRQFTERSLRELQQAVSKDEELRSYLRARLSPGGTLDEICRHLGWTAARGRRVSRRFQRRRESLLQQTDIQEECIVSKRSDRAPATWYLERLHSGLGVYQHTPPGPPDFYGRKPVND